MYQTDFRRAIEHEYLQTAEVGIDWKKTEKFQSQHPWGSHIIKYERLS